jgi:hypothetical protein
MNSTMNDTVLLKVNQTYDVTLSSRGSSGFRSLAHQHLALCTGFGQ